MNERHAEGPVSSAEELEQSLAVATLEEARLRRDIFVVLQGSEHQQIYLTCPAVLICCWEPVLKILLRDLDALACESQPSQVRVRYEQLPVGHNLEGGRGGGQIVAGLWIHPQVIEMGLERPIKGVLKGKLGRIPLRERVRCSLEGKAVIGGIVTATLGSSTRTAASDEAQS